MTEQQEKFLVSLGLFISIVYHGFRMIDGIEKLNRIGY